jgi:hypothetical protein
MVRQRNEQATFNNVMLSRFTLQLQKLAAHHSPLMVDSTATTY